MTGTLYRAFSAPVGPTTGAEVIGPVYQGNGNRSMTLDQVGPGSARLFFPSAFGATGDGIADDTEACQDAINAAAGIGSVVFPANRTYLVAGLTVPSNSRLQVDGTLRLKTAANATVLQLTGTPSSIVIEGRGTIDGNRAAQTSFGCGIGNDNTATTGILVRGITVTGCFDWPVNLTNVSNSTVQDCILSNSGNSCEFASHADNCWFVGNTVFGIADGGITLYGGCTNCGAIGNTVHDCVDGIGIYSDNAQTAACHDCIISDNTIYSIQNAGISVSAPPVFGLQGHYNISIHGNRTRLCGLSGAVANGGIQINNAAYVDIRHNSIRDDGSASVPGASSIVIYGPSIGCTVLNNTIVNCGRCAGTNNFGITVYVTSLNVAYLTVRGNTIIDDRTPALTALAATSSGTLGTGFVWDGNTVNGAFTNAAVVSLGIASDSVFNTYAGGGLSVKSLKSGPVVSTGNSQFQLIQMTSPGGAYVRFNTFGLTDASQVQMVATGGTTGVNNSGTLEVAAALVKADGAIQPSAAVSAATMTGGSGAPTGVQPAGSMYIRDDAGAGTWLYRSTGGGGWTAVV